VISAALGASHRNAIFAPQNDGFGTASFNAWLIKLGSIQQGPRKFRARIAVRLICSFGVWPSDIVVRVACPAIRICNLEFWPSTTSTRAFSTPELSLSAPVAGAIKR
jgi:hypothetical protein